MTLMKKKVKSELDKFNEKFFSMACTIGFEKEEF